MIKNRAELIAQGLTEAREKAIDILNYTLNEVEASAATKRHISLEGDLLRVQEHVFDLTKVRHIYAIGAGKATYPLAKALEDILGDRITDGFIVVKDGQKGPLSRIRLAEASHPVPDERSFEAAKGIFEIADGANESDLVFCLMSGGVSALCTSPVPGVTHQDKIDINRLLVHSGAEIREIMTVRRHLSSIKGGRLTQRILPATIIVLTVSDSIGDEMEWNTDWTSPDSTTLDDAVNVLKKYDLWEKVSGRVQDHLSHYTFEKETPKSFEGISIYNCMVVKTQDLWKAAERRARQLELTPLVLTSLLMGESREVGRALASISREVLVSGNPVRPPCVLIASGETSVKIEENILGKGGRNQELAIGACLDLEKGEPIVICSLGTDGTDGPTDAAGGIIDSLTKERAAKLGIDVYKTLMEHNVLNILDQLGDTIITGPTGTNVCDIALCVVMNSSSAG
ncbi:MAG: DUF4147 domain-containing protein [Deltaproteobacteria bacterium]|nr:DUF4147 domain-containing protein [Deltaproteobacteria bacterium]